MCISSVGSFPGQSGDSLNIFSGSFSCRKLAVIETSYILGTHPFWAGFSTLRGISACLGPLASLGTSAVVVHWGCHCQGGIGICFLHEGVCVLLSQAPKVVLMAGCSYVPRG